MKPSVKPDRDMLLEHIAALAQDEDSSSDVRVVFLPLVAHRLALRPDVVIVEGTRGAGKTALFRLVHELGPRVREFFEDQTIPLAKWVDAYSESIDHPSPGVLDELVNRVGEGGDAALRAFWLAHLLARLRAQGIGSAALPSSVEAHYHGHACNPAAWIDVAQRDIGLLMASLDAVERDLAAKRECAFASYDNLDRLGVLAETRSTRQRLVRSLLALWLSCATRYKQLRGKIYLRPDLFEEAERSFPDASKLRPRSVSLSWEVASLFRLAVRHLANRGPHIEAMRGWLLQTRVTISQRGDYGWMPDEMGEAEQRLFAAGLAGETMGSGPKKGYTYRWMPARIKDAGGRIVPRSFIRLLRNAALATIESGLPRTDALMESTSLVGALRQTSKDRVAELTEEYPFVRRVANLEGKTMLMERSDVVRLLAQPRVEHDGFGCNGDAVFDELERIGVLDVRSDGRIDVPDIYRYGYGIKRRGGAKAPK
jgi:hypothetical protein